MPIQFPTLNNKAESRKPKSESSKKGFTLIELLVAVSIIAIISAVGVTSFNQSQVLARDSKRKQDLRAMAVALEYYYQANKTYPKTATIPGEYRYSTNTSPWIPELTSAYINTLPIDPINTTTYRYWYYSGNNSGYTGGDGSCPRSTDGGKYYILYTNLENTKDPETLTNKNYFWCDGQSLKGPPYNWQISSPNIFIVSSK